MAKGSKSGGGGGGKGRQSGMGGNAGLGGVQGRMGSGLRGDSGLAFTAANTRADFGQEPVGGVLSGPGRPGASRGGFTSGGFSDAESGGGEPSSPINNPLPRVTSDFGTALSGFETIANLSGERGVISQPSNPGIELPFRVPAAEIEKITEEKLMKPDVTASSTSDMKGIYILAAVAVITGLLVKAIKVPSV